jgi:hypothetical protein
MADLPFCKKQLKRRTGQIFYNDSLSLVYRNEAVKQHSPTVQTELKITSEMQKQIEQIAEKAFERRLTKEFSYYKERPSLAAAVVKKIFPVQKISVDTSGIIDAVTRRVEKRQKLERLGRNSDTYKG